MTDIQVKIEKLEALRVICFNGFGENPEMQAMEKLRTWASINGIKGRIFGYNNPNPAPGSPNYGYDIWMVVAGNVPVGGEGRMIDFPGGLYAVTCCVVSKPWEDIPSAWQELVRWVEASPYRPASHQWLEEHLDVPSETEEGGFVLDLYMPVKE